MGSFNYKFNLKFIFESEFVQVLKFFNFEKFNTLDFDVYSVAHFQSKVEIFDLFIP